MMAQVSRERLLGLTMPETSQQQQQLQKDHDHDHKEWELSEEEVWDMVSFHGAAYAQSLSYGAAASAAQAHKAIESSRKNGGVLPRSGSSISVTSQRYGVVSAPMKVPEAERAAIRAGCAGAKQRAARSMMVVGKKNGEGVFGELNYVEDDDHGFGSDQSLQKPRMIPPHLIMSHQTHMTSSVMEGAGRTLKGRDLRNVRNAVWKHTGFFG